MHTRFAFAVIAVGFVLLVAQAAAAASRDAFVGTWQVIVTPDEEAASAGEKEYKDTLIFKGMQLRSAKFAERGFEPGTYEEDTRAGIAATFKAELKSKKNQSGTATWSGTSQASTISGELTWTKPDGTVLRYSYKGERKN